MRTDWLFDDFVVREMALLLAPNHGSGHWKLLSEVRSGCMEWHAEFDMQSQHCLRFEQAGRRKAPSLLVEHDVSVVGVGLDDVAVDEFPVEHVEAERVQQQVLDGALEGARAIDGIVALAADELLGGFG